MPGGASWPSGSPSAGRRGRWTGRCGRRGGRGSRTAQGGPAGTRTKKSYGGLTPLDNSLAELLGKNSFALLEIAAREPRDGAVEDATRELRSRVEKVNRDVLSKRHERAAMSVACLVM